MDFDFGEEQTAIRELAREILAKEASVERVKRAETSPGWTDETLWKQLAEAGLLGIAVPAAHGGAGMGFLELCCLLEQQGRHTAPLPLLETLVLGALPLARFGTDAQRAAWLPRVAAGEALLTAALDDAGSPHGEPPHTRARRTRGADGFTLVGRKRFVPFARRAERVLVPAALDDGRTGLFLVPPDAEGLSLRGARSSTGAPLFELELADVRVPDEALLGGDAGPPADALAWLHERALVGLAALQLGVCDRALELTAGYVSEREQFGVPIGSFQAVQHRAADAFIDLEALRWSTWRAAWRLAEELPCAREAAVAKFWAADAGARITGACVHLHGGMGADTDYPVHRHFLWAKALELALGGATPQLAWLGRELARRGREADAATPEAR